MMIRIVGTGLDPVRQNNFFHPKDTKTQRFDFKFPPNYKRLLPILLCLLLCFMLFSCKKTTSTNYDETRITEIMYNMESAFNNHDIDALMAFFSNSYLHKGQSRMVIREVWLDRMATYLLVDFENITIDQHNDEAVVSFRMKLSNSTSTIYSDEPSTHGDISYFCYDNETWKVYGNQQ